MSALRDKQRESRKTPTYRCYGQWRDYMRPWRPTYVMPEAAYQDEPTPTALGRVTIANRPTLTYADRDAVRWLISQTVRESIHEDRAARLDADVSNPEREAERINALAAQGYKGIVKATEVRVSERGASGEKGIRGTASRVTVRDARDAGELQDAFLMRGLATVGVATHPLADAATYDAAIRYCRAHSASCTVRVTTPTGGTTIRPVADYVTVRNERREARKARRLVMFSESRAMQDARLRDAIGSLDAD